jgi:hypothetical protein
VSDLLELNHQSIPVTKLKWKLGGAADFEKIVLQNSILTYKLPPFQAKT